MKTRNADEEIMIAIMIRIVNVFAILNFSPISFIVKTDNIIKNGNKGKM